MLCTSAAFRLMTMSRLNKNSLTRRAAGTAALFFGLGMPALATTTHKPHHATAAKSAPATTAKTPAPAKAPVAAKAATAKTVSTHTKAHTHVQAVAAKKTPAPPAAKKTVIAHAAPVPKPSTADFAAAARVHAWEASQHNADSVSATPAADTAPATKTKTTAVAPTAAKLLPGADTEPTPALADAETQVSPMIAPAMVPLVYNKRGHVIMPAALKGSHEILLHQNEMADSEGLDRIQDDDDLARKVANKQLVRIPVSAMLHVDDRLPDNRRYCRPWVAQFLTDMAQAHYARFHTPLQVNSAVRTVEFQDKLRRTNGNAAPSDGDTASPHLTGFAVDIAKRSLSQTEVAWMRGYLLPLEQQGKIDVEEEFQQSCFHMSVYRKYMPTPSTSPTRSQPASSATDILATGLR